MKKEISCPKCKGTGKIKYSWFTILKEIREEKHLTQKDIGEQIGLSAMGLSHFETGKREPKLVLVEKWCDALGVDMKYLFN